MRALLALALLLAAGCGDSSWSGTFEVGPQEISVVAWKGKIRLRNGAPGRLDVTVRGEAPVPLDSVFANVKTTKSPDHRFGVAEAAKDADLEIEIAAPPGSAISCACAAADVEVAGAWGRLSVKTAGAISARVERADSGALESLSGDVLYVASGGPTGELAARATRGDVTIRLPASWNGQIDCTTQGGTLDVPPHKELQTIWDEDRKHVVGRVGPRFSTPGPPRVANMGGEPDPRPLIPTVWGSSAHGNVSLHLAD